MVAPAVSVVHRPPRFGQDPSRESLSMRRHGPTEMAVRADDVALGSLRKELHSALERGASTGQVERFRARIPMIEVHLHWQELAAAVSARNVAKLTQECRCRCLAARDASDFAFAVRGVVANVVGPLHRSGTHASV